MAGETKKPQYSDNHYRHPGDFRADRIYLYNYGGSILDISNSTAVINIYQSLDSAFVSGNLLFFDEVGATDNLPIIGNEYLEFKLRTPIDAGGDEEINATNHRFQVYERKSVRTSQNVQAVALFFSSIESVRNERIRVSKSLTGTYADMIDTIVKTDKTLLNSKKDLFIDPTLGVYKYTFPNVRPTKAIGMLTGVSEPINFKTPHYMFYENNRGFHYRCLESLFRESADNTKNRAFVAYFDLLSAFNPNFSTADTEAQEPMTKPYSFTFEDSFDTLSSTRNGMWASNMYAHDLFNKRYTKTNMTYSKYYEQALHIDTPTGASAKYQGVMPPGPADFDDEYTIDDKSYGSTNKKQKERLDKTPITKGNDASNRKYMDDYPSRVYVTADTRQNHIFNADGTTFDSEFEQKQYMSKSLRDYFSMTVDVPGNFTYNVGDLVWCEIPTYNAAFTNNDTATTREEKIDKLLTGRYLIKSLHHQIDFVDQKHTTSVSVCRNIFASEMPNAEVFKAASQFRTKTIDVVGSGIDISTLTPFKNAKELKIPTPQISTVEDVAAKLGVDINSTDLNVKDAANKAVNAVINSTSNRVIQNKYVAQINSTIANKKSVIERIASKVNVNFGGFKLPSFGAGTSNPMGADRIASRGVMGRVDSFVKNSIVNFKKSDFGKSVSGFFNRFK